MKTKQERQFDALIKMATNAANDAGDKWLETHKTPVWAVYNTNGLSDKPVGKCLGTMLDVCGFSHISVKDKRTAFAKYLKKIQISWNGEGYNGYITLHTVHRRQELGLNTAMSYAAIQIFEKAGIKGLEVYSRID
jgi:hypothetical protein